MIWKTQQAAAEVSPWLARLLMNVIKPITLRVAHTHDSNTCQPPIFVKVACYPTLYTKLKNSHSELKKPWAVEKFHAVTALYVYVHFNTSFRLKLQHPRSHNLEIEGSKYKQRTNDSNLILFKGCAVPLVDDFYLLALTWAPWENYIN